MRIVFAALLAVAAASPVAFAQDRQAAPGQAPPGQAGAGAAASMATNAAPQTEEEVTRSQEVVCRTQRITGSLTRRTRVCATRAEWEDNARRTNQEISRIAGGANGSPLCRPGDESGC